MGPAAKYTRYQAIFTERLNLMVQDLNSIAVPQAPPFAALFYLKQLLNTGYLSNLRVEVVPDLYRDFKATGIDTERIRMRYELLSNKQGTFSENILKVDHRLVDSFFKVEEKAGSGVMPYALHSFLTHEFLHYSQGMGHGEYQGLGSQAPNTLLALDYQADALAIVALTILALLRPENWPERKANPDGIWDTYLGSIEYAILQMEAFTHQILKDMDRTRIASGRFSLDKLQRTVMWQYQYHRAKNFNRKRSLADFQILSQPHFHFRNLEAAWAHDKQFLKRSWPRSGEKTFIEKSNSHSYSPNTGYDLRPESDTFCILAAASPFGTTRFVRIANSPDANNRLFEAIFEGNLNESKDFFEDLFKKHPWLVGKDSDDDRGGPGGGEDSSPPDLPSGTDLPMKKLTREERHDLISPYLLSTVFPLTTMKQPAEVSG